MIKTSFRKIIVDIARKQPVSFGTIIRFSLIVVFLSLRSASDAHGSSSEANLSKPVIQIKLEPYVAHLLQNEPFIIRTILRNVSDHSIRIPGTLDPSDEVQTYEIDDEDKKRVGFDPRVLKHLSYPPDYQGILLKPGSTYTIWTDLTWTTLDRELIDKPQRFTVKAYYKWEDQVALSITKTTAESPVITITVEPPKGVDLNAFERLNEVPELTLANLQLREKHYRTVMALYPESRYAKYAHVNLAGTLSSIALFPIESSKFIVAAKEWNNVSTQHKHFGFTDYAREREAWCLYQGDKKEEALKKYHQLLLDPAFPDSRKWSIGFIIRDMIEKNIK
ncbi:MAG: hypothetical protein KY468_11600 [Armatimonadetes bacterium]|nr:hypothetical protein [Armatimonadota bacterium]